jgi:HK97 family phage portal protein
VSLFFRRPSEVRMIDGSAFVRGEPVSGIGVEPEKALRLVPVYAAIRMLADAVASLPMSTYRIKADGARVKVNPTPSLLVTPCASGTSYDWVHRLMVSLLAHGNAFGIITQRDRFDWPTQIEWVDPTAVYIDESKNVPAYYYNGYPLAAGEFIHVPGFVVPGSVLGLSPISAFAATIDTGLYAQNATRDWYKNGAMPSATLKNTAQIIDQNQARELKTRYRESVKAGDVLVHGQDWDFNVVGISAQDAQFLEAIKATATQVASIYGIPPEKIGGETGSSMTYATTEQQAIDFLMFSVRPWVVRLERALGTVMPNGQYVKFNVDSMIRTDVKTRWDVYRTGADIGAMTINEIRALEERPPVPWGDEPMASLSTGGGAKPDEVDPEPLPDSSTEDVQDDPS